MEKIFHLKLLLHQLLNGQRKRRKYIFAFEQWFEAASSLLHHNCGYQFQRCKNKIFGTIDPLGDAFLHLHGSQILLPVFILPPPSSLFCLGLSASTRMIEFFSSFQAPLPCLQCHDLSSKCEHGQCFFSRGVATTTRKCDVQILQFMARLFRTL